MGYDLGQLILGEDTAPKEPVAQAPLSTSEVRAAADINNPSGLGWNGKTWKAYATPEEGVADTQALVSNYLANPARNTPQAFVGTWVNGDPKTGASVQGGAYVAKLHKELEAAGVKLNENGTIPNTPEANAAVTRAIIQHESAPQHVGKFMPHVSSGAKEQTDAYAPADKAIPTTQAAEQPSLGDLILGGTELHEPKAAALQVAPQAAAPLAEQPTAAPTAPAAPVAPPESRSFKDYVKETGKSVASFLDNTIGGLIPAAVGLVAHPLLKVVEATALATGGKFNAAEATHAIVDPISRPFAKAVGIDPEDPAYKRESVNRLMTWVGEHVGENSQVLSDKFYEQTGVKIPPSDFEYAANLGLAAVSGKAAPVAVKGVKGAIGALEEQFAIKKGEAKPVGERIEPTTGVSEVPIDTPEIRALSEKLDANRIKYDELNAAADQFPKNTPERMAASQKAVEFYEKNVDPIYSQLERLERNYLTPQRGVMPETNVPVEQLTPQEPAAAGNLQQQFAQKKMEQMPVTAAANEPIVPAEQITAPTAAAQLEGQFQGLKGAGAAEIEQPVLRQARANQLDVPIQLSKDQATRDPADVNFARETAKDPVLGAGLQAKYASDNAKLQQNLDIAIEKTGAEYTGVNPGDLADMVVKVVEPERKRRYGEVSNAYTIARDAGEMSAPIEIDPLKKYLDKNSSAATNAPVLTSVAAELKKLSEGKETLSINDLEEVRKMVNNISEPGTPNGHYGKEINRLIDRLTEKEGGELYRKARKLNAEFMTEFEDTPIIRNLTAMKKGTTQRVIAMENLIDKSLLKGSLDDVKQLFGSFERMGPAGESIAKELRGFVAEKIKADATSGVNRDINGRPYLSTHHLNKIITDLDKSGKLDFIFGREQADKFRTINEVTKDLQTVPVGTTNTSGTASTLLASLAEMGIQSTLGLTSGMPVPVLMIGKHLYKNRQTSKKLNKIQEFLDYGKNLGGK